MEKEIKIEVPKGYEIDVEKSNFSKIVFKKTKNELPQSFEDLGEIEGWYVDDNIGGVFDTVDYISSETPSCDGVYPTKELAEASVALAKLLYIRKAYVGDWEPDYNDEYFKYCIASKGCKLYKDIYVHSSRILSFPNEVLRDKFFKAPKIKKLLEIAKPLL